MKRSENGYGTEGGYFVYFTRAQTIVLHNYIEILLSYLFSLD